jgi:hypothetical protein
MNSCDLQMLSQTLLTTSRVIAGPFPAGIGITQIEPQNPIVAKNSAYLSEDPNKV